MTQHIQLVADVVAADHELRRVTIHFCRSLKISLRQNNDQLSSGKRYIALIKIFTLFHCYVTSYNYKRTYKEIYHGRPWKTSPINAVKTISTTRLAV